MASRTRWPWRSGVILVREALAADASALGEALAQEDRYELQAAYGLPPAEALLYGHSASDECYAAETEEGNVIAMWGVMAEHPDVPFANAWLLAAPAVRKAPIAFSKIVKSEVSRLSSKYGCLCVYSDARNGRHIRWLRRIGFRVRRIIPRYGYEERPFYEMTGAF